MNKEEIKNLIARARPLSDEVNCGPGFKGNQLLKRGQPDMIMNEEYKYEKLGRTLRNDLRGLRIEADPDLLGYILSYDIGQDQYTLASAFTVYVCPEGYSLYIAYDDIAKGIRIEDERPLLLKEPSLGSIIRAIKTEQVRNGTAHGPRFANYFGSLTPSEGVWKRACPDEHPGR
jgi:hypothetical protein